MTRSALGSVHHLARQAVIAIRQSTRHQGVTTPERLHLPYALRPRARQLGWRDEDIDVMEADVGLTAVAAEHRAGCTALVTSVTRSQVGLILSLDVTRRSRHLTDGYPRVDSCGSQGCRIADRAGVDDPGPPHGRFWRGVQGTLSAMARQTIRARLTAGLRHKAARGDLARSWPLGLGRDPCGQVHKPPDREVPQRRALLVATLLRVRTASQG